MAAGQKYYKNMPFSYANSALSLSLSLCVCVYVHFDPQEHLHSLDTWLGEFDILRHTEEVTSAQQPIDKDIIFSNNHTSRRLNDGSMMVLDPGGEFPRM